ncbi:RNA ligase family protein [Streptomyces sp. NPDC091879]|uniref:RNA ligase family protein n=1 Tax=Streptomyces sp. NPDC091879 TaxID=3366006 RepID=UPI0038084F98
MSATDTTSAAYPKFRPIPRLHRKVVLTEKIDGTNGLIEITKVPESEVSTVTGPGRLTYSGGGQWYLVAAGSRNRWLTPDNDNFGFAAWVWENSTALIALGEGKHYGEWFGKGIQSGYGLDDRRFALFNVNRWYDIRDAEVTDKYLETFPKAVPAPPEVTVVPVILVANGNDLNYAVNIALHTLKSDGSFIAPGFKDPEGVVVWHDAAGAFFKATIKNDEAPKSKVSAK